jgi:hypothetical protein
MANHVLKLLTYYQSPNCCCVILWAYPNVLYIKKHSTHLNESLYQIIQSLSFLYVEMLPELALQGEHDLFPKYFFNFLLYVMLNNFMTGILRCTLLRGKPEWCCRFLITKMYILTSFVWTRIALEVNIFPEIISVSCQ